MAAVVLIPLAGWLVLLIFMLLPGETHKTSVAAGQGLIRAGSVEGFFLAALATGCRADVR